MSSSASSWRRGRTWSAPRSPATSSGCRTRCRRSRNRKRKPPLPPRSAGRSARSSQASVRRLPPPRLRRCTGPRSRPRRGRAPSPSRCCGPASNIAFAPISRAFTFVARHAEDFSAEARRLRLIEVVDTLRRSVTVEMDFRLEAAALSEMAENTKDDPDFRVPAVDWDRTSKEVLTLEWIDATPLSDRARLEAKGFDLPKLARALIQTFLRHALRDGFFHADMHPGNLFVDDDGRLDGGRFRHHGPARGEGALVPGGDPARLHHPRLSPYRRGSFRGRLCAAAAFDRKLRAGHPRHRRADPQPHRRRYFHGAAADAVVRGDRPVRHAHAAGIAAAAEDDGGGRRRGALARSQARHVVDRRAGGARMDDAQSRSRPASSKAPRTARPRSGVSSATRRAC